MKNVTTFVHMRSDDHLGDSKMSKKAPCSVEIMSVMNFKRQKRLSQNERRSADLQSIALDILIFTHRIQTWFFFLQLRKTITTSGPLGRSELEVIGLCQAIWNLVFQVIGSCETIWHLVFDGKHERSKIQNVAPVIFNVLLACWSHMHAWQCVWAMALLGWSQSKRNT